MKWLVRIFAGAVLMNCLGLAEEAITMTGSSIRHGFGENITSTFKLMVCKSGWKFEISSGLPESQSAIFYFDRTNLFVLVNGVISTKGSGSTKKYLNAAAAIYPQHYPLGGLGFPQAIWFGLICAAEPSFKPLLPPDLIKAEVVRFGNYSGIDYSKNFPEKGSSASFFDSCRFWTTKTREIFKVETSTNFNGRIIPTSFSRIWNFGGTPIEIDVKVHDMKTEEITLTAPEIIGEASIVDYRLMLNLTPLQYESKTWLDTNAALKIPPPVGVCPVPVEVKPWWKF